MDLEMENLEMADAEKKKEERCSKCNTPYPSDYTECPKCGLIFKKTNPTRAAQSKDFNQSTQMSVTNPLPHTKPKPKELYKLLIKLLIIGIFIFGAYFIYINFLESYVNTRSFKPELSDFCRYEITEKHADYVGRGGDPFRTGKVLVVTPHFQVTKYVAKSERPVTMENPDEIHPAWHKLNRSIRAKNPDEVDTVIRISKELGEVGHYGDLDSKVWSTHKIILDVYDWQNDTYIGTKIFDPGEMSQFMTEKEIDTMMESVSDDAIADYIESMELYI